MIKKYFSILIVVIFCIPYITQAIPIDTQTPLGPGGGVLGQKDCNFVGFDWVCTTPPAPPQLSCPAGTSPDSRGVTCLVDASNPVNYEIPQNQKVDACSDQCPTGLQSVWTMGGPICAKVYDTLPDGCTDLTDITSKACHPELHGSIQLPGQQLGTGLPTGTRQDNGAIAPNDGWILCSQNTYDTNNKLQCAIDTWFWNGPGPNPGTPPPPNNLDTLRGCQAVDTTVCSGQPPVVLSSKGGATPANPGLLVGPYQNGPAFCASTGGGGGSSTGFGSGTGGSASSAKQAAYTAKAQATLSKIYAATNSVATRAVGLYIQSATRLTAVPPGSTPTSNTAPGSCYVFTKTLQIGSIDSEVPTLVKAIRADGETFSGTGFPFDVALSNAVTAFQEKYKSDILTPIGLSQGTGIVAEKTRAKLNQLCLVKIEGASSGAAPSTPSAPVSAGSISINPTSGISGSVATITGSGFPLLNNVIFGPITQLYLNSEQNGTVIHFVVPYKNNNGGVTGGIPLASGPYQVSVANAKGTTSPVTFTVTTNAPSSQTQTPTITSIIPDGKPIGTIITITGTNFSPTGNEIRMDGFLAVTNNSSDGRSLSFVIPPTLVTCADMTNPACQTPLPVTAGTYKLTVSNVNFATSNSVPLTITQ